MFFSRCCGQVFAFPGPSPLRAAAGTRALPVLLHSEFSTTLPQAQATSGKPRAGPWEQCVVKQKTTHPTTSQSAFYFHHAWEHKQCQWQNTSPPWEASLGLSFKQLLWLQLSFNYTYINFKLAHFYYFYLFIYLLNYFYLWAFRNI